MKKTRIDLVEGELEYLLKKTPLEMRQHLLSIAEGHQVDFDLLLYVYNIGFELGKEEGIDSAVADFENVH